MEVLRAAANGAGAGAIMGDPKNPVDVAPEHVEDALSATTRLAVVVERAVGAQRRSVSL